jgi:dihydroorotase
MAGSKDMIIEGLYRDPDGRDRYGQIKVVGGMIEAVGKGLGESDISYGRDCQILPGFIDIHVHARDCPLPKDASRKLAQDRRDARAKEDYTSVSRAAANGGVVAIGDMPNKPVAPVDADSYQAQYDLASRNCAVDVVVYALIEAGTEPFGDVPYKLYTHDHKRKIIRNIFRRFAGINYDPMIIAHCESLQVINQDPERPREAEVSDIGLVLELSKQYKIPVHIPHLSTAEGLELILDARKDNVQVTCETTPTYLRLSRENRDSFEMARWLWMKPPLRTEKDRMRLLEAMIAGEIDMLATDHAPHTRQDKEKGMFGLPLIDNYTNFVGWLMQQGVSPANIVDACCVNPGRFMERYIGLKFGRIEPGSVGSFTVVKRSRPRQITREDVMTKCAWTPFEGVMLGDEYLLEAHETIVRGKPLKRGFEDIA